MDDADTRLEICAKPVYYPVRRSDAAAVMNSRLHKIRDTLENPDRGNVGTYVPDRSALETNVFCSAIGDDTKDTKHCAHN
jgi:hypothetical protein